jgi:phage I-like protein
MPTPHTRFRAPLNPLKLAELAEGQSGVSNKIQIIRVGNYKHPDYGNFKVTLATLQSMVKNHEENVRGIDLAIDYGHAADREAAAWIKKLSIENESELWAEVEWTPTGASAVGGKEYRYLSADFDFEFTDNESNQKFGPTLFGAGLTNRPFVKNMAAVSQLSEIDDVLTPKQEPQMDPKDQEIADLKKQIAELQAKLEADGAQAAEMKKKLEEKDAADKAAAEQAKLAEKKGRFDKMLSEGKACEAQRESYMKDDFQKFTELAQPVKLTEQSKKDDPTKPSDKDPEDEALELAQTQKKDISTVLSERPDLAKKIDEKQRKALGSIQ